MKNWFSTVKFIRFPIWAWKPYRENRIFHYNLREIIRRLTTKYFSSRYYLKILILAISMRESLPVSYKRETKHKEIIQRKDIRTSNQMPLAEITYVFSMAYSPWTIGWANALIFLENHMATESFRTVYISSVQKLEI